MAVDATMYLLGCMMIEQQQKLQRELDQREPWTGQIVGEAFDPERSDAAESAEIVAN
jgi:hypothetical protein